MSLVDAAAQAVADRGVRTCGILASPTTIKTKLYEDKLRMLGIQTVVPTKAQQVVTEAFIRNIISGRPIESAALQPIIADLQVKGAEALLLGCTELSVAFASQHVEMKQIDPLEVVANTLLT